MEKKISILGHDVTVTFNMAVEIAYETITDQPFSAIDMNSVRHQYALCMAAVTASKSNDNLPDNFTDRLLHEARREDIQRLIEAVTECMTEFLHIPAPMKQAEDNKPLTEAEQEEARKNA